MVVVDLSKTKEMSKEELTSVNPSFAEGMTTPSTVSEMKDIESDAAETEAKHKSKMRAKELSEQAPEEVLNEQEQERATIAKQEAELSPEKKLALAKARLEVKKLGQETKERCTLNIPKPAWTGEVTQNLPFGTPSEIPIPQTPSTEYQVEGEQRAHQSLAELRAVLVQQFLAMPPDFRGNAGYSLSQTDKDALIPHVMGILKTLESMKRASPDISINNEIESLELPDGSHVETFRSLVTENMGDQIADYWKSIESNLSSTPKHVEPDVDSQIHAAAEMQGNLPVQVLNKGGMSVIPEGQMGILGETTVVENVQHPNESEFDRDKTYSIMDGTFKSDTKPKLSQAKLDRQLARESAKSLKLAKEQSLKQMKSENAVRNAELGYRTLGKKRIAVIKGERTSII